MFHAFLRSIFGILPLFLALVPDDSSASMNDFLENYEKLLFHNIVMLEKEIEQYPGCKRSNNSRVFCSTVEVNITGLEVFCNSALKRDIYNMACRFQKMTKKCNFTEGVVYDLTEVSDMTLEMLKDCNNNTGIKRQRETPCANVRLRKPCRQCVIKDLTSQFKSCWGQVKSRWTEVE